MKVNDNNQNLHNITEICGFVILETLHHTDDDNFLGQLLVKIFITIQSQFFDDIQSQFSITTLKSSITILKRLRFSITILKRFPVLSKILVTKFVVSLNNVQTTNETPLRFDISTLKTSQELRMLSSVTINCQVTMIVLKSGSQF